VSSIGCRHARASDARRALGPPGGESKRGKPAEGLPHTVFPLIETSRVDPNFGPVKTA
jgi:hypothetical protein